MCNFSQYCQYSAFKSYSQIVTMMDKLLDGWIREAHVQQMSYALCHFCESLSANSTRSKVLCTYSNYHDKMLLSWRLTHRISMLYFYGGANKREKVTTLVLATKLQAIQGQFSLGHHNIFAMEYAPLMTPQSCEELTVYNVYVLSHI